MPFDPSRYVCTDTYDAPYAPSDDISPPPPFPCPFNPSCTEETPICEDHKRSICVRLLDGRQVWINWKHKWETGLWIKDRVKELLPDLEGVESMRLIFAGNEIANTRRHPGLQIRSKLHLIAAKQIEAPS